MKGRIDLDRREHARVSLEVSPDLSEPVRGGSWNGPAGRADENPGVNTTRFEHIRLTNRISNQVRRCAHRHESASRRASSSRSCRRRAGALGWWDIDHYGQVADTILTDVTRKDGMVVVDDCVVLLVDGELCDVVDEDVTLSTVPVICTL
jgi:hypothetical protein